MFRKYLLFSVILLAIVVSVVLLFRSSKSGENLLTTVAQKGKFESLVYSTGQLESVEADYIPVPIIFSDQRLRLSSLVIADIVDEGTYVDSGAYVATIDHATVDEQQKTAIDELNRIKTELEDSKIDSNLTLSNQRDQIVNAQLEVEEKRIVIDESAFEAPSVKRKAEMDYEKSKRKFEQMNQAYLLKQQQEAGKVNRKLISYKQAQDLVDLFQKAYDALRITAPRAGVIGYFRYSGGGAPIKTTSQISVRSPAIATFPKMNLLVTNTYINEIDISKIKIGQKVTMGIDAFPEKVLYGEVANIANVGQLTPRSDAKVFEVKINVRGNDEALKPSMTTSNIIQTAHAEDVVYVPIESVFKNDSLSYVYKLAKQGKKITRQEVKTGIENESFVVIEQGVAEGDKLCLEEPANAESFPLKGLDLNENRMKNDSVQVASLPQQVSTLKETGNTNSSK